MPQRAKLLSRSQTYGDAAPARTYNVQVINDHTYYYKRLASENIPKLYVRKGTGGSERLLVDPEAIKGPEGKHYAIDWFAPSLDNKYVAYGLSLGGSEQSVLHVKDVATGKETGDRIDRANLRPARLDERPSAALQPPAEACPGGTANRDNTVDSRVYLHTLGERSREGRRDPGPRRDARHLD